MWLILVMAGVATVIPELEWTYGRSDHSGQCLWNLTGLATMFGGTAFRVWAIWVLGKHFTATVRTSQAQALIQRGPYRFVRHPSYLGAFLAILGCAILLQAWTGAMVAAAAMGYAYYRRIVAEESALVLRFGDQYRHWQSRSWRIIPFVW